MKALTLAVVFIYWHEEDWRRYGFMMIEGEVKIKNFLSPYSLSGLEIPVLPFAL